MNHIIILIPPSEGKATGGEGPPLADLPEESRQVIESWKKVTQSEWSKALGVKDKALEKALRANQSLLTAPTMPAIERYSGVVYSAIDYPSLSSGAKEVFNRHVRIVSAVFGLVKPQDLIPDYKCKINHFGLDKYWRPINEQKLKGAFVIDLLPKAHKKAVAYEDGIEVDFHFLKNGKRVPAGHQGKSIKGKYIRWLVQQKQINMEMLKAFNQDGFAWRDGGFCVKKT